MNFTSYPNALILMEALGDKLKDRNTLYTFKGGCTFSDLPAYLTADMCGYVYIVTDAFTTDSRFVEGAGVQCEAGTNVLVANKSLADYRELSPVGTENPSELGWYEKYMGIYLPTSDTTVISGKKYYEKFLIPDYKFDIIGYLMDVDEIVNQIDELTATISSNTFDPAKSYDVGDVVLYENGLYVFKEPHPAGTEWDDSIVKETSVQEQLDEKANQVDVYTKEQVDDLIPDVDSISTSDIDELFP